MNNQNNTKKQIASFLEILPSLIFVAVNFLSPDKNPLIGATFYLIISTLTVILIIYLMNRKISKIAVISGIVLSIFGGLTVFSGNETFIKVKPTIVNVCFALILLIGNLAKKPLLSKLFGNNLKMTDKNYMILSTRFAVFFLFLAMLNEFIWRNFSTDFWVNFKVFGMFVISFIFTMSQTPFILKNQLPEEQNAQ